MKSYNLKKLIRIEVIEYKPHPNLHYRKADRYFFNLFGNPAGIYEGTYHPSLLEGELPSNAIVTLKKEVLLKPHVELLFEGNTLHRTWFDKYEDAIEYAKAINRKANEPCSGSANMHELSNFII